MNEKSPVMMLIGTWLASFLVSLIFLGSPWVHAVRLAVVAAIFGYIISLEHRLRKLAEDMKGNQDTLKVIRMIVEQEELRYRQGTDDIQVIEHYANGQGDTIEQ